MHLVDLLFIEAAQFLMLLVNHYLFVMKIESCDVMLVLM